MYGVGAGLLFTSPRPSPWVSGAGPGLLGEGELGELIYRLWCLVRRASFDLIVYVVVWGR